MPKLRPDDDHDRVRQCLEPRQVVIAPPGTGKTYLAVGLAGRWAARLRPYERVLVLTFSNQARSQLEREAGRQLDAVTRGRIEITNYHRLYWHAVNAYRRLLGLPESLGIVPNSVRDHALSGAVERPAFKTLKRSTGLVEALAEHAFECFRDQRTPDPTVLERLLEVVSAEQRAGRLVFEDLGALFWLLLDHPAILAAYTARFPVVIADEHQDASRLQDAVVRRLGMQRRLVFADPMQLIHEFRGADDSRLTAHVTEAGKAGTHHLRTPHRWHGAARTGQWLLDVRARLLGKGPPGIRPPAGLRIRTTPAAHGRKGMVLTARFEVLRLRGSGLRSIAVLARDGDLVAALRDSFSRNQVYPRQIGGSEDFEDAHADLEFLATIRRPCELAMRVLDRVQTLAPALDRAVAAQVRRRLQEHTVDMTACGERAKPFLEALQIVYVHGRTGYVHALSECLLACRRGGWHVPRRDALHAIQQTADALDPDRHDVDAVRATYQRLFVETQHAAPRVSQGVFVMTAHQSKGREFDAIIIVGADARSFPATRPGTRLFYVALTRARQAWVLIHAEGDASPLVKHLT